MKENEEIDKIKVFKMNDYEWWASKQSKEETNEFYKKEMQLNEEDNPISGVFECNLNKTGIWYPTTNKEDIDRLGDSDKLISEESAFKTTLEDKTYCGHGYKYKYRSHVSFGDLKRQDGEIYKFIPLREAILHNVDFKEPYCIASTEW